MDALEERKSTGSKVCGLRGLEKVEDYEKHSWWEISTGEMPPHALGRGCGKVRDDSAATEPKRVIGLFSEVAQYYLQDDQDYESEVVRVARGGIPVVPAGVRRGSLSMCQGQVLRDVNNGGRPMDENQVCHASRQLAGFSDRIVEIPLIASKKSKHENKQEVDSRR